MAVYVSSPSPAQLVEGEILTGTIDDTSGRLTASGTYQSSDFTTGTWVSNSISMPSDNSIFFSASLTNQTTGNCLIAIEYVGFK